MAPKTELAAARGEARNNRELADDLAAKVREMVSREKLAQAESELSASQKRCLASETEADSLSRKLTDSALALSDAKSEIERLGEAAKSMVPRGELLKAQTDLRLASEEASSATAALKVSDARVAEQGELLVGARDKIESLQAQMESMVPRADLISARSDAKNARDELESKARAASSFEEMNRSDPSTRCRLNCGFHCIGRCHDQGSPNPPIFPCVGQ
jgi:chromosome segregation ATPase